MKKLLSLLLVITMCMALILTVTPASAAETKTIKGWSAFSFNDQTGIKSYNEQLAWIEIAKRTGIQVEWVTVSGTDRTTQFSLVMASGDLPDFFVDIDPLYYEEFGRKGALIPLNDILTTMPNLQVLFEQDPWALPSITSADGNVYFLPRLLEPAARYWPGLFIREDYLAKVGLPVPTTTAELKDALVAIKAAIPECTKPITGGMAVVKTLVWPFGVGSRGVGTGLSDDAYVEDGVVKFGANDPRYRDSLKYIRELFDAGLIDPEWNTVTGDQTRTNMITGESCLAAGSFSGMMSTYNGLFKADGKGELLTYVEPLAGPAGIQTWAGHHTSIDQSYGAAITSTSKNAATVAALFDYTYSDEGRELIYWGIEGDTFEAVDGKNAFTQKLTASNLGVLGYLNNYSANTSCYPSALITEFYHATLSAKAAEGNLKETALGQAYDIRLPAVRYTEAEIAEVNAIRTDLNAYVDEYFAAFITGVKDINDDAAWDAYVKGFDGLRLEEIMGYYNAAYARFVAAAQ